MPQIVGSTSVASARGSAESPVGGLTRPAADRHKGPTTGVYCGVDVGASATKVVLVDGRGEVLGRAVLPSGVDYAATAVRALAEAQEAAGLGGRPTRTVSCGYGRNNVPFADATQTEIHCHGTGCFHLLMAHPPTPSGGPWPPPPAPDGRHGPRATCIVDIGGQDNKVIRLGRDGRRLDFKMNRKCAAGTGAFLEEIALRLGLAPGDLEGLARSAAEGVRLSSFCTVFAKTEVLSHLRKGVPVGAIVRGAFESVVERVIEMDPLDGEVVLTGGVVAHNPIVAEVLSGRLKHPVIVPPFPQFTGALGAALSARKSSQEE